MYIDSLFQSSNMVSVLNTQYRMSNQIGELISSTFYDGLLINGKDFCVENSLTWIDYVCNLGRPEEDDQPKEVGPVP